MDEVTLRVRLVEMVELSLCFFFCGRRYAWFESVKSDFKSFFELRFLLLFLGEPSHEYSLYISVVVFNRLSNFRSLNFDGL